MVMLYSSCYHSLREIVLDWIHIKYKKVTHPDCVRQQTIAK